MAKLNRPITTLFLIQSLDGKISTGIGSALDVDRDFSRIGGVKEGLHQYYELEQETDLVSFNSAKVLAKVGVNAARVEDTPKSKVSYAVVDNAPHLTSNGLAVMAQKAKTLYIVTSNESHPAFDLQSQYPNLEMIKFETDEGFAAVFDRLGTEYGIERITIQTGGTLNAQLLKEDLIDHVRIVVAPCLVGGANTPTLVDGESLHNAAELIRISPLELVENRTLEDSYVLLSYNVIRPTRVDEVYHG